MPLWRWQKWAPFALTALVVVGVWGYQSGIIDFQLPSFARQLLSQNPQSIIEPTSTQMMPTLRLRTPTWTPIRPKTLRERLEASKTQTAKEGREQYFNDTKAKCIHTDYRDLIEHPEDHLGECVKLEGYIMDIEDYIKMSLKELKWWILIDINYLDKGEGPLHDLDVITVYGDVRLGDYYTVDENGAVEDWLSIRARLIEGPRGIQWVRN